MITELFIENLGIDSVSVLTKNFIEYNGTKFQVGGNHRKAYVNSERGRKEIMSELGEPYLSAVMAVWGDNPTVVEKTDDIYV